VEKSTRRKPQSKGAKSKGRIRFKAKKRSGLLKKVGGMEGILTSNMGKIEDCMTV